MWQESHFAYIFFLQRKMYVKSGCNAQHVNLRRKYIPIGVNKFGMTDIFFIEKIKDRKSKFPMWREKFQVFGNAEINSLDWIQLSVFRLAEESSGIIECIKTYPVPGSIFLPLGV